MSDSKELLEATIKGLQEKVEQVTKDNCYNVDSLSVTVNGERYNII